MMSAFGLFLAVASAHAFSGSWITDAEMATETLRPVCARQLQRDKLPPVNKTIQNRHVLFRRTFDLGVVKDVRVFVTADDYYKLYVNGAFAGQGPAAGTTDHTYYNEIDVTPFVTTGRNVIAVHTYYQGLVNRVWVSGDHRHGLLLDLVADGKTVVASDASFRTARHRAYSVASGVTKGWPGATPGTVGYDTQFMERYDAGAAEVGFERFDFDDVGWVPATVHPQGKDYRLFPQPTPMLAFEDVRPVSCERMRDGTLRVDFGGIYVGAAVFSAHGGRGSEVVITCGQELNADGSVRHKMRCNCDYVEQMVLSGGPRDVLNPFDYKSFRYLELKVPEGAEVDLPSIVLKARHMPFELRAKPNFGDDPALEKVWRLCVDSFRYGVQEQIQDCMDREKGYYLGDGVISLYAYCVLTGDWSCARRFVDDFLRTRSIDRGLMTCACCSFMQEIAEFPFMLVWFVRAYLEETGDADFVRERFDALADVLDSYRERYAREDGLLVNLDKWCVVEWPQNYQDGYDADIREGKVCTDLHNAINAWYIGATKCLNAIAAKIGRSPYADVASLEQAFRKAFWDEDRGLFVDREGSRHVSMPGNVYAAFFALDAADRHADFHRSFMGLVRERGYSTVNFYQYPALLSYLRREGESAYCRELIASPEAWLRMLREGATRTFEGWGRDAKWNTSLFHLTLAGVAAFLCDNAMPRACVFERAPLDLVDPLIGTEGTGSEYGGMMPMTGVPFGSMHLVPMTRTNGVGRTSFNSLDQQLLGFVLTRQPAIWMGEWGAVRIPLAHPQPIESIEAHPHYTRVRAGGKTYELTASSHVACIRTDDPSLGETLPDVGRTSERTTRTGADPKPNFACHWRKRRCGNLLKVFVSLIDGRQAEANGSELPEDFDAAVRQVRALWETLLGRFEIEATDEVRKIFYTGLYHALLYPREMTEGGRYYSGIDDRVHEGVGYDCFSLWDTYRAEHPLLTLLVPERVDGMVQALVNTWKAGGWLPLWQNLGYTGQMVGGPAEVVISEAYVKGFRGFDVEAAWQAVWQNATVPQQGDLTYRWPPVMENRAGPPETRGGLTRYMMSGYVACDETDESVSRTLDYALDDASVARFASALGKNREARLLYARSRNYTNLWNAAVGRFWPRRADGTWVAPDKAGQAYTETSPETARWCVPHDVAGLVALMGGREAFIVELDRFFDNDFYRDDGIGRSVHGNETGHHVAYLYNRVGAYDKTCRRVHDILMRCYSAGRKGFDGNEDCGQMSAWYVLSALGFYPLDPSSGEYELGSPHVRSAVLRFGRPYACAELKVVVRNYAHDRWCVKRVTFNGRELSDRRIRHDELVRGGELVFEMND